MIYPSDRKKLFIEFYYIEGAPPFICGIDGHATIGLLEGIESDWQDCPEDYFNKGQGKYLFLASPSKDDGGSIYWELDFVSFESVYGGNYVQSNN